MLLIQCCQQRRLANEMATVRTSNPQPHGAIVAISGVHYCEDTGREDSSEMEMSLSIEDVRLLQRVLDRTLGELRQEIVSTENREWRQSMHGDEDRLKALIDCLAKLPSA